MRYPWFIKFAAAMGFVGLAGLCALAAASAFEASREYTVLITRAAPPAQIIGRIQTGLNKTQAEGVAFQLNEVFTREHSEWKAIAAVQQDISTLPKTSTCYTVKETTIRANACAELEQKK